MQYSDAFAWSHPLPRYLPGLWAGFGGYDFFFYAPLPFWLVAAVISPLCPGCSPETAFVLGSSFFLPLSGLTFFAFLRRSFAPSAAAFGAVCYALLPYHLFLDWFHRQDVGEFTAYAFLPLIALGIETLRRGNGRGWILALGVAGVSLSHLPTALLAGHMFAPVCLTFVGLSPGGAAKKLKLLGQFAWYALLGGMLSSFYWLPAITLLHTVSPEILYSPYFEAWRWLYGPGQASPNVGLVLILSLIVLAEAPLLLGSLIFARGSLPVWIALPASFSVLMNLELTEPIWRHWVIGMVQFPWRLMIFVDVSAGVAAAALAAQVIRVRDKQAWKRPLAVSFLAIYLVAFALLFFSFESTFKTRPAESYTSWVGAAEYFSPEMAKVVARRLGKEKLDPFDQSLVVGEVGKMADEFRATATGVEELDRQPRSLTVVPQAGRSEITLPVQFWFLWQAKSSDGTRLETRVNSRFGALDVLAPPGGFDGSPIVITLPFHWSEIAGFAISTLTAVLLIAGVLRSRRSRRHQM